MTSNGSTHVDVAVIGGGIIGLAVAWRARRLGMSVTVVERDAIGEGASRVAAGMLAPVSEAEFGEHGRRVLELGLRSAAMWPGFAAELQEAAGSDIALRRTGTLMVAYDDDEARELDRQAEFRHSLGLRAERLRASEAREREPALAPVVRLALEAPDDHSLDPRLAVGALRAACERTGILIREHAGEVSAVLDESGAIVGVRSADGTLVGAERVVVATGAWSAALQGLPESARVPVRAVKGQIMLMRDPEGPGLISRAVRYAGGYVVPRTDGRFVVGATMEERGFDPHPTAGATYEMLRHAHEVLPGVSELELLELGVGYRPGTPDNAPIVGWGALANLVWATGHYRNGILLTPLTAELVAGLLGGQGADEALLELCDPLRFNAHRAPQAALR